MRETLVPGPATEALATVSLPARLPSGVPRHYLDPPAPWNPTVALFLGGYALAALSIWGWFVAQWPLPPLLVLGFLAMKPVITPPIRTDS